MAPEVLQPGIGYNFKYVVNINYYVLFATVEHFWMHCILHMLSLIDHNMTITSSHNLFFGA